MSVLLSTETIIQSKQLIQQLDEGSETSTEGDQCSSEHSCSGSETKNNTRRSSKAKSSLCRNFAQKGHCPYGHKCQFAHGLDQLKCNVDENNYKTKPCHSYWKKNYCVYGFRCNFSHSISPSENEEYLLSPARSGYREIMRVGNGSGSRLFLEKQ